MNGTQYEKSSSSIDLKIIKIIKDNFYIISIEIVF